MFLQSFPWRGLLVYYLLGFVLEYYPPSARARYGLYALAPFALAWTVATPHLFTGQQVQVGIGVVVDFHSYLTSSQRKLGSGAARAHPVASDPSFRRDDE